MTNTLTVHVRSDETATILCPACGTAKHISAASYRFAQHTLLIRCRCNETFNILLDFRRHYRKQTQLHGTYQIIGGEEGMIGGGILQITNISRSGVGFTVSGQHRIEKDQDIRIEFQLNDKNKTVINKLAKVRTVRENTIGCEFIHNVEMDKALGFYLQF